MSNNVKITSEKEYRSRFKGTSQQEAFHKAWEIRNFEIELYWKRATYFWAFISATFAAYFAMITTNTNNDNDIQIYIIVGIGFILSLAWLLSNKGSKSWQTNWENHIDLLENEYTGPLYKTISSNKTFSVSKINETVSLFFTAIWLILAFIFLIENAELKGARELTIFFIFSAIYLFISGQGNHCTKKITMHERNVSLKKQKEINYLDITLKILGIILILSALGVTI